MENKRYQFCVLTLNQFLLIKLSIISLASIADCSYNTVATVARIYIQAVISKERKAITLRFRFLILNAVGREW